MPARAARTTAGQPWRRCAPAATARVAPTRAWSKNCMPGNASFSRQTIPARSASEVSRYFPRLRFGLVFLEQLGQRSPLFEQLEGPPLAVRGAQVVDAQGVVNRPRDVL